MNYRSFYMLIAIPVLAGCSGDVSRDKQQDPAKLKEHLVNANKIFVENEAEQIEAYQQRRRMNMQTSGTGLRYAIFPRDTNSNGNPVPGDTVELNYQVMLLDGSVCYDTKNSPVTFTLGKAEMPRGMEEAVMMMHEGDSCVIILPSHLAYGFTGDGDKIPGNAATIYYISLLRISGPG